MAEVGHHEMAYAVNTRTCTYLLDEDGVCRWIVSPEGVVPPHVRKCIGAQFVACLDLGVEGGLVGELRSGARALFVQNAEDHMVLLRTGEIQRIDDRRQPASEQPPPAAVHQSLEQYGKRRGLPYCAQPPTFGIVRHSGEEQTITVNRREVGTDAAAASRRGSE